MPGLADYLGKVGPKYIYLKAEAFWDFILLLLLFFYLIKKAFHTVRDVQESGLGILRGATRALTGESRESKTIDNVIAFILALVFTFGITAYTKISLKFLFVTTGVLPAIIALFLGFFAYGQVQKRTNWGMPAAVGIAFFVGGGVYSLLFYGGDMRNQEWLFTLFSIAILLLILTVFKGAERPERDASTALASTSGDVDRAINQIGNFENRFKRVEDDLKTSKEEHTSLLGALKNALDSLSSNYEKLKRAAVNAPAIAAAIAFGMQMQPASPEEIRKALSQAYDSEVVEAAMEQMPEVIIAPEAPAPAAPRAAKPGAAPSEEAVKLPEKDCAVVAGAIKVDLKQLETAQRILIGRVQDLRNISTELERMPTDYAGVIDNDKNVQGKLTRLATDADKLIKLCNKPDSQHLFEEANRLKGEVEKLRDSSTGSNASFTQATQPLASLLKTDCSALKRLTEELNSRFVGLKESVDLLEKRSSTLKRQGVSKSDVDQYLRVYENVERLLTETMQILESHGSPDVLLPALQGFNSAMTNHTNVLTNLRSEIKTLSDRWKLIYIELKDLESARGEEKKAKVAAVSQGDKIKNGIQVLDSIITGISRPKEDRIKANIPFFKNNAAEALELLNSLEIERMKILGLPAVTKSTNRLTGLLANLKKINLRNDLVKFIEECDKAEAKPDSEANKILENAFISFQGKEADGEPYMDYLTVLVKEIGKAVDELPKNIGNVPPAA